MRQKFLTVVLIAVAFITACSKEKKTPPIDHEVDLDGSKINDSSLQYPSHFLLSARKPSPADSEKTKKVFIAVHGFSASNFEWQEFAGFCTSNNVLVSRVLLGGHGRDYHDFRTAKWTDWQKPIVEEYERLTNAGYSNINFIGASTGCPLVLEMLQKNKIDKRALKSVYFIDPIIVSSNKQLSLAPVVGGTFIHYTTTLLDDGEKGYWYKYRPQEALKELNQLINTMRKDLEKGIDTGAETFVYKSEKDGAADPVSAVLLEKGLANCKVKMVTSDLHVFTRLKGRPTYSADDKKNQLEVFTEIIKK